MRFVVFLSALLSIFATSGGSVDALAPNTALVRNSHCCSRQTITTTQRQAFWRHWIPETNDSQRHQQQVQVQGNIAPVGEFSLPEYEDNNNDNDESSSQHSPRLVVQHYPPLLLPQVQAVLAMDMEREARRALVHSLVTCAVVIATSAFTFPLPSGAVSGGGLDFAGLDISGQDFSKNVLAYKGKDFTQVIAKGTNFAGSNLQGCRFYKAYLVRTWICIYI